MTNRSASSLLALLAGSGLLTAGEVDVCASITQAVKEVLDARSSAVVKVEATDRHGKLCGTGFFADPAGTIYTVYSTVGDSQDVWVHLGEEKVPATVLLADKRSGVALLKVDRPTPFLPLAAVRDLQVASPVVALGYPLDLDISPSFGIVGGFDRKYLGRFFVTTHVRASVPVQAGFGGAPLLNFRGEVVGMVVAGVDGGAACYALPIEAAEKIRMNYARFGEARHGWVGVTVEGVPGEQVRIAELGPETPAAKSGLREGDRLLQVGSVGIDDVEDVLDASYFLTDGDPVEVRVEREGQELRFSVYSIPHPTSERDAASVQTVFVPQQFNLLP
jgi:serine protease Do